MSLQVASQTKSLPLDQGMIAVPEGSNLEGTLAEDSDLWMMLFNALTKMSSLTLPAAQPKSMEMINICTVSGIGELRRPIAILTVSSFIQRPKEDIGRAFNQALDSQVDTDKR